MVQVRTLRREAERLKFLIQSFRNDRAFLRRSHRHRIIYAIDSADLTAFIRSGDDEIHDFLLAIEREYARRGENPDENLLKQVTLKQEQIHSEILFRRDEDVIVLPPHWQELEDQIERLALELMPPLVRLSELAEREIHSYLQSQSVDDNRALGEAYAGAVALSERDREELVEHFTSLSPALLSMHAIYVASALPRIERLLEESHIMPLEEVDWHALGIESAECAAALRRLQPDWTLVEKWRKRLSDRPYRRDTRGSANFRDAEALVWLQQINETLQRYNQDHLKVHLLTRSTTLIDASLDDQRKGAHFPGRIADLRHPRLYVGQQRDLDPRAPSPRLQEQAAPAAAMAQEAAPEDRLSKALDHFVSTMEDADRSDDAAAAQRALESLWRAWQDFEMTLFAFELHRDTVPSALHTQLHDQALLRLFDVVTRFQEDPVVEPLVITQLDAKIERFERRTNELGQERGVVARLVPGPNRRLLTVGPASGVTGIAFEDERFLAWLDEAGSDGRITNADEILSRFHKGAEQSRPPAGRARYERFLAWALLKSGRSQWRLAQELCRFAITAGQEAGLPVHEARFLQAQAIRRRGFAARGVEQIFATFDRARRLLDDARRGAADGRDAAEDPRFLREQAAQILALRLASHGKPPQERLPSCSQGLELCEQAATLLDHDSYHLRVLLTQLRLCYALAISLDKVSPGGSSAPPAGSDVERWHRELSHAMAGLERTGWPKDELPLLARVLVLLLPRLQSPKALLLRPIMAYQDGPELARLIPRIERSDEIGSFVLGLWERERVLTQRLEREGTVYLPVHATHYDPEALAATFGDELRRPALEAFQARLAFENLRLTDPIEREASLLQDVTDRLAGLVDAIDARPAGEVDAAARYYANVELAYCRLLAARNLRDEQRKKQAFEELLQTYASLNQEYPRAVVPAYRLASVCYELKRIEEAIAWSRAALERLESDPFEVRPEHPVRLTITRRLGVCLFQQATELGNGGANGADPVGRRQALMLQALEIDLDALTGSEGAAEAEWRRLERRRLANNALHYAISFLKCQGDPRRLGDHGYTKEREQELLELAGAGSVETMTDVLVVDTIREVQQFRGRTREAQQAAARVLEILKIKAKGQPLEDADAEIFEEALALLSRPTDAPGATA